MWRNTKTDFTSLSIKTVLVSIIALFIFITGTAFGYRFLTSEGWNFLDSFYFTIITLTSVGYGDFVPQSNLGKIVNLSFIFLSIFLLLLLFRIVIGFFVDYQIEFLVKKLKKKKQIEKQKSIDINIDDNDIDNDDNDVQVITNNSDIGNDSSHQIRNLTENNAVNESLYQRFKIFIDLFIYLIWLLAWTLFFRLFKGEELGWLDAVYFGIVTSATVGYGDITPVTNQGI